MQELRESNAVGHQLMNGVKLLANGAGSAKLPPVHLQVGGALTATFLICFL